ncbi:cytochrome b/b6 domain-containing protein [Thiothrix nivea]|uniref:Cytochrome b561 n=1 Tax=Thiothrix nivea (strain ATCC 35100 / DSM 5205 / JP2) TaxID=870187 RepID=A0A656HFL9_THINJ|nr:cytochrome b/b6 domain-containing protein [Thiothrix nivea]EIJ34190.1 cytochrome b561 [Thiothrix nivea DSM 5205]
MESKQVKVWDPLVRIFHWSLVLAFAAAYLTGEEWGAWEEVHEIAGYAAVGLILFRIVWGFVGSRHARFSDFLYAPKAVVEYLKSLLTTHPKHYLGHNPAGGWMVMLLLAGVLATGLSGLKLLAVEEGEGPFATLEVPALISVAQADNDRDEARERTEIMGVEEHEGHEGMGGEEEGEEFWEEIHEVTANLTLFLIIIHVLGVIVSSRLHGENLVRAMVTGKKNVQ